MRLSSGSSRTTSLSRSLGMRKKGSEVAVVRLAPGLGRVEYVENSIIHPGRASQAKP